MGRKKHDPAEGDKRELILKTAQALFVTQGYGEVSMDALAEAVPVSKRTLYNHFRDKKALFIAVMQRRCQFIADRLQHILFRERQDVRETLTACARQFVDIVLTPEAMNIYRTAITQAQHFPDMGKLFYESGPKRSVGILAEYLESLDSRGVLHVSDPMRSAGMFLTMLKGNMQIRMLLGVDKKISRKEMDEHIRYVVEVFLRGQSHRSA
jgi:TetR/AcrR family transcriptional regulator, mexJK operon transcriptional repressor